MSPKSHFLLSQTSGKGFLTCCSSFLIPIHSLIYCSRTIFLPPSNSQRWSTASLTRKCKDLCTAFTSQQRAILLTHNHKDHTGGLDDVRSFNYLEKRSFPIYCEAHVLESLKKEYYYVFTEKPYPGAPEMDVHVITSLPFDIDGVPVVPIRAMHYKLPILGFRFGDCAYVTDANYIPETEFEKLKGLKIFVLNTVKRGKHISHYALEEAIEICRRVGAEQSYLTHLSHMLPRHAALTAELATLPFSLQPAYDGLTVDF